MPPTPPPSSLHAIGTDENAVVSPASGPSAAQSSRRAKNAAHRAHDVGKYSVLSNPEYIN